MPATATARKANLKSTLAELRALGTDQNRKIYKRHGAGDKLYGVSFANLRAIRKRIRTDHELALQLWETGNTDARILATMISNPEQTTAAQLDSWIRDVSYHELGKLLCRELIVRTPLAQRTAEKWVKSPKEYVGMAGWTLIALLAMQSDLPNSYFEPLLKTIEKDIHSGKNRKREAMNNALIAIGSRSAGLAKKATAAAKRIGTVEVDHGDTGCKTPDAVSYIARTRARKAK